MDTPRDSPAQASVNKMLWAGVAIVLIMVLAMGSALIRIQAQPQEPRLAVLPSDEAPPTPAPPVVRGASAEAATSAAPLAPASTAIDPIIATNKPRIVHPRTSEPAVARTPERPRQSPQP